MQRTKMYVLVPVEIETYVDDEEKVKVGCIVCPGVEDVERALEVFTSFMDKEDAWNAQ